MFWQKKMSEGSLTKTPDVSKVPNNCKFLAVKKANKEIWSCTSPDVRTRDFSLQKMQETHSFMTSTIMQAVNELGALKSKSMQPIMDKLKDALKLAGKTNQQINTHRRDSFKPSIPPELRKLNESPEEDSEWLFGDNLKEKVSQVKGENLVRDEFLRKWGSSKCKQKVTRFTPYNKRSQEESQEASSNILSTDQTSRPPKSPGEGQHQGNRTRSTTTTKITRTVTAKQNNNRTGEARNIEGGGKFL